MRKQTKISTFSLSILMLSVATNSFAQIINNPDDINWNIIYGGSPIVFYQDDGFFQLGGNVREIVFLFEEGAVTTDATVAVDNL